MKQLNFIGTLFFLMLFASSVTAQTDKPFIGMLEYTISVADTSLAQLVPDNKMIVYCNDTIVRIENFTQHLGKQVTIRHMALNKSYLLVETPFGKYAIRADHNEIDSAKANMPSKYTFTKKHWKRKILGRRAKRMEVSHEYFEQPVELLYLKGYSPRILDVFDEVPGLPVKYTVATSDANFNYELVKMSEYTPNNDLFGIPSDFEKIGFEEFMDKMIESKMEHMENDPSPKEEK